MRKLAEKIVKQKLFEHFIIALILINAVILGMETSPSLVTQYGDYLLMANNIILGVFIIEAILKITAVAPRFKLYVGNGWNLFDFSVVVLSLIPTTGEFAMIARLARLLRVARLISTIPELRIIVSTLVRSIPSMGHVLLLMSIIFYIYGVAGYLLFHEHDPTHWNTLGLSLLTLFRVVTLEDWTDVMYKAMELYPMAWMYFVSFVVVGTFVVINLFIAVVINNLEEAKHEQLEQLERPTTRDEILRELKQTQDMLAKLQNKLAKM
jgi:voltage-gated sodium channel